MAPWRRALETRSRLDRYSPRRRRNEEKPLTPRVQELVHRLPRALPVAVVVEDHHAPRGDAIVEVLELVPGGVVPVGVEPENRDLIGRLLGNSALDQPRMEADPFLRIPRLAHGRFDVREGRDRPDVGGLRTSLEESHRRLAVVAPIPLRRLRHALERVEEVQLAIPDATFEQRVCNSLHAAAPPNTAFDDRAR